MSRSKSPGLKKDNEGVKTTYRLKSPAHMVSLTKKGGLKHKKNSGGSTIFKT